jgi:two-component system sensor kinase FixL
VFSSTAVAAAGYAVLDMVAPRAGTAAEYGALWQWTLSLGMLEGVLIALFIRLHLRAGRWWLFGLICGLLTLMLFLNFVPGPNFYFREITSLQQTPLLGELISRPLGLLHPWAILMLPSLLLLIIFAIDAARTAAKRDGRRRP